ENLCWAFASLEVLRPHWRGHRKTDCNRQCGGTKRPAKHIILQMSKPSLSRDFVLALPQRSKPDIDPYRYAYKSTDVQIDRRRPRPRSPWDVSGD
ncbi:MAG: hypothetical protein WBA62_08090, partial [Xanthobacteraceae bacterium]